MWPGWNHPSSASRPKIDQHRWKYQQGFGAKGGQAEDTSAQSETFSVPQSSTGLHLVKEGKVADSWETKLADSNVIGVSERTKMSRRLRFPFVTRTRPHFSNICRQEEPNLLLLQSSVGNWWICSRSRLFRARLCSSSAIMTPVDVSLSTTHGLLQAWRARGAPSAEEQQARYVESSDFQPVKRQLCCSLVLEVFTAFF